MSTPKTHTHEATTPDVTAAPTGMSFFAQRLANTRGMSLWSAASAAVELTPIDHEIILPNSVTRNKSATTPTSTPPLPPRMSDTASISPESTLISRTSTAAPMPNAEKR